MMNRTELGFREDFNPENRVAKQETFIYKNENYFISTVDLGINHGFLMPLYYETMIFAEGSGGGDCYCQRYSTKEEAIKGHQSTIESITNGTLQLIDGYFEEVEEDD